MRIVITGGAGFLGRKLARRILELGALTDAAGNKRPVEDVLLLDVVAAEGSGDRRVRALAGHTKGTTAAEAS